MDYRNGNSDYSNIRDFTSLYISDEIELPKDFPKSYPIDNRIKYLFKVEAVFNPNDVEGIAREIRTSKKFWPDATYQGGVRHFYIQDHVNPYKVQFLNGQVQIDSITSPEFTMQSANIKKILIIAMERLAKELKWINTTHKISCNAIDYLFSKGASEPLSWHTDKLDGVPAEHSFIILLSDPTNNESGWGGGDLLYTTRKEFRLENLGYNELEKTRPFYLNGALLNEPKSIVWQVGGTKNDGILFGNRGMNHKVTVMEPLSKKGQRLILTVFDYGEAKDEIEDTEQPQNNPLEFTDMSVCKLQ